MSKQEVYTWFKVCRPSAVWLQGKFCLTMQAMEGVMIGQESSTR